MGTVRDIYFHIILTTVNNENKYLNLEYNFNIGKILTINYESNDILMPVCGFHESCEDTKFKKMTYDSIEKIKLAANLKLKVLTAPLG